MSLISQTIDSVPNSKSAAELQQLANDSKMPDEKERHAKSAQYYLDLAEKEGRFEHQK